VTRRRERRGVFCEFRVNSVAIGASATQKAGNPSNRQYDNHSFRVLLSRPISSPGPAMHPGIGGDDSPQEQRPSPTNGSCKTAGWRHSSNRPQPRSSALSQAATRLRPRPQATLSPITPTHADRPHQTENVPTVAHGFSGRGFRAGAGEKTVALRIRGVYFRLCDVAGPRAAGPSHPHPRSGLGRSCVAWAGLVPSR